MIRRIQVNYKPQPGGLALVVIDEATPEGQARQNIISAKFLKPAYYAVQAHRAPLSPGWVAGELHVVYDGDLVPAYLDKDHRLMVTVPALTDRGVDDRLVVRAGWLLSDLLPEPGGGEWVVGYAANAFGIQNVFGSLESKRDLLTRWRITPDEPGRKPKKASRILLTKD